MKIKGNRFVKIIGLAAFGGLISSPLVTNAQDQGNRPPEFRPDRPAMPAGQMKEKPDFEKIRGMVRELAELKRAGKHEEANHMAGRIKEATGNNPRICAMLGRVMAGPDKAKPQCQAIEQAKPQMPGKRGMASDEASQNPRARLQHLRMAARHLSAAGCEDLANGLKRQIAQMETRLKNQYAPQSQGQLQQPKRLKQDAKPPVGGRQFGFSGPGRQDAAPFRSGPRNAASPHAKFPDFRMNPKSDGVGPAAAPKPMAAPDANAAILSEIKKMRQEMGELRNQVRRVQANATPGNESKKREGRPNAKERPDQRPNMKNHPDQRPGSPQERPNAPMPPPMPPQGDRPQ